jgi:hypothetical protein
VRDITRLKEDEIEFNETPISTSIFQDRSLSVLESIVRYLKDEKEFTNKEIAQLLNRDERTIWTVYDRVRKKQQNE